MSHCHLDQASTQYGLSDSLEILIDSIKARFEARLQINSVYFTTKVKITVAVAKFMLAHDYLQQHKQMTQHNLFSGAAW